MSRSKVDCLQSDEGREFINISLQIFYQKRKFKIGYIILYIYKKNGIDKQYSNKLI